MLDDGQDAGLEVLHDGVGPEAGVAVEVGGEALVAGEVEEGVAVGEGLEGVLAVEDVEVAAADGDVLVEGGGWDVGGVGLDGEGEAMFGLPGGDGFEEEEAVLEGGVADAADALVGEGGFDGAGEAEAVGPGGLKFGGGDGGDASMLRQMMAAGA